MGDAASLFDLAATISLKGADGVDASLNKTQKEILRLAKEFQTAEKSIHSSAAKVSKSVQSMALGPTQGPLRGFVGLKEQFNKVESAAKTSFTNVSKSSVKASQDVSQALSTLSPQLGAIAGAAGPLAVVAAGLVAIGAASVGIYNLAVASAQLGGEIYDLSQKVNFSAETLSSMKVAAELSGGSLASLSTSLGIFDRNMVAARESGSEMSKVFGLLKIDTQDNEKAWRQAVKTLYDMGQTEDQVTASMKLFGRSGKDVLGVVKETHGNVDQFIAKMRELGFVITSEGARKADAFGDSLTMVRNQFDAVMRQIGAEFIPLVSKAATDLSKWLKENQGELRRTASEVASLVEWVYKFAAAVAEPFIVHIRIIRQILDSGPPAEAQQATRDYRSGYQMDSQGNYKAAEFDRLAGLWGGASAGVAKKSIRFPGGGGGGGGGGAQKDILEGLRNTVMSLHGEYRKYNVALLDSANLSAVAAEKEKLLANVMSSLNTATKAKIANLTDVDRALEKAIGSLPKKSQEAAQALVNQALAQFQLNERTRIGVDLNKQASELAQQWRTDIDNTRSGADQYDIAIQSLEKAFRKQNQTLDDGTKLELQYAAALQRSIDKVKQMTRERTVGDRPRFFNSSQPGPVMDLGGGSFWTEGGAGEPRPRIATVDRQIEQERIQEFNKMMEGLASGLTVTIDDAITDGFRDGVMAGVQTFTQGLLDMVKSFAWDILEKRLMSIFSNALGGGKGGGSILDRIFSGISTASSAFAGGGGGGGNGLAGLGNAFAGGYAAGGFVPPNSWATVGEEGRELIRSGRQGATVVPNGAMGGSVTLVVNYNAARGENPASGPTVHQMAKLLHAQMVKVDLTG